MSELISRQAAIDALDCLVTEVDENGEELFYKNEAYRVIEVLPSVQPERAEGHWINGKCDRCGEHAPFWAMASTYHESNYCPNCGAKMKGET